MELNEAIDNINLLITNLENMRVKEIEPENYILLNSLNTVLEELNNRIPIDRINEQIRFLNDEGYFEFNTKRDLEKATEILNNLLNKE